MEEVGDEPDDMEEAVVEDGGPELEPEPEPELDLEPAAEDDGYGDEGFVSTHAAPTTTLLPGVNLTDCL